MCLNSFLKTYLKSVDVQCLNILENLGVQIAEMMFDVASS